MRSFLTPQTEYFLDAATAELDKRDLLKWRRHHPFHYPWRFRSQNASVDEIRQLILDLELMTTNMDRDQRPVQERMDSFSENYPIYSEIVGVTPIYRDAVSLECHKPIVKPSQIPGLLYLLRIPGYPEGVDVENHGFGYHFHYGKIKSDSLIRTNLLFTFNPNDPGKQKKKSAEYHAPLYFEYHAEGKNKVVDVEAIGENKRLPIYLVCHGLGKKRGLNNFKQPGAKAGIFFENPPLIA